jgi:hypothetical protein
MLGHVGQTMTSRYQHSADAVLLKAADAVADETARLMGDASPQEMLWSRSQRAPDGGQAPLTISARPNSIGKWHSPEDGVASGERWRVTTGEPRSQSPSGLSRF